MCSNQSAPVNKTVSLPKPKNTANKVVNPINTMVDKIEKYIERPLALSTLIICSCKSGFLEVLTL